MDMHSTLDEGGLDAGSDNGAGHLVGIPGTESWDRTVEPLIQTPYSPPPAGTASGPTDGTLANLNR
ncbi:hypothetical protein GCM10009779_25800 [Polymorphospora rubra]|uniref:Uncharacterized protein n=1 Tax=Polymorphospora rubra TaxID=338584 RepID=A0A810N0B0_9ACTN|nr:hypothetical protein Prubr_38480 [Polymorphospora rubra]